MPDESGNYKMPEMNGKTKLNSLKDKRGFQ
jgi:hypothetical protein